MMSPSIFSLQPRQSTLLLVVATVATGLTIGILPWETSLAIVIAFLSAWMGFSRPDLGLAAIALSVPIQRTLLLGFGDTAVTVTKIVLWAVCGAWFLRAWFERRPVRVNPMIVSVAFLVFVLVISGWNARDGGLWIGETYRWMAGLPVLVMAYNTYMNRASFRPFLFGSALGTVWCGLYAGWQVIAEIGPPSFESRGLMRASGPFTHPNQLALYLETTTPLLIAVGLTILLQTGESAAQWSRRSGLLLTLAGMVGLGGLFLSQSRGGGVGIVVGMVVVLALLILPPRAFLPVQFYPVAIVLVLVVSGLTLAVAAGWFDLDNRSVQVTPANFAVEERIAHWVAGTEMAVRHIWFGVGAGNFDLNFRDSTHTWRFRIGRGHAHNTHLQMLAQAGIVGLVAYLGMILVAARTLWGSFLAARSAVSHAVVIGIIAVTAALSAHAFFEYIHVLSLNLQLMIGWGLAAALGVRARRYGIPDS